jgi:hypothetical protein
MRALAFFVVLCACSEGELDVYVERAPARDEVYDDGCLDDDGCVVAVYATCGCASCGDLAIAAVDVARFDADNVVDCPPAAPVACGACDPVVARCIDGACALVAAE